MDQSTIITDTPHDRKVWVINTFQVPPGEDPSKYVYKENFRGSGNILIPPNSEKKVLMSYLKAERFLGVATAPFQPNPDGTIIDYETGEPDMQRFGKPLKIVELTPEEKKELDPMSLSEKEREKIESAELAKKSHVPEGYAAEPATTHVMKSSKRASKSQAAKDLSDNIR